MARQSASAGGIWDDGGLRSSPLLPIFLIVAVDILGYTLILPLLPFYAEHMGASPIVVGMLVSVYAVCQLLSGPVLGQLSDRFGRKPLLIISQIGTLIGFLVLAFSDTLWLVFLSRVIDGATAGNLAIAQAHISDVTPAKDRARSFGIIGIAFGMGFLIGPAVSGFLSQFGYRYPIFAAAGLSAVSILATTFLLHPRPKLVPSPEAGPVPPAKRLSVIEWGRYAQFFRDPTLSPLLWKFFSYVFSFSVFIGGFALFAERRYTWEGHPFGPKEVGYIFAYSGLIGGTLQGGALGSLVRRFGERPLLAASLLASAAGYLVLGWAYTIPMLLLSATISAFGGIARPVVTSLITQIAGRDEQGTILGLTQSLTSVAQIIGPVIAGALIEHQMLSTWAVVAAVIAMAGWLVRMPEPSGTLGDPIAEPAGGRD
jgi:MFS transporter, DHA1 family, tetracycline resistance protein